MGSGVSAVFMSVHTGGDDQLRDTNNEVPMAQKTRCSPLCSNCGTQGRRRNALYQSIISEFSGDGKINEESMDTVDDGEGGTRMTRQMTVQAQ